VFCGGVLLRLGPAVLARAQGNVPIILASTVSLFFAYTPTDDDILQWFMGGKLLGTLSALPDPL
jgi:hypothetical protein